MGALDRLNKFTASTTTSVGGIKKVDRSQLPYDDKTIQGYFFNSLLLEGFGLDEMKPIIEQRGNKLVLAIAGSGKTTYLEFQLIHDIITGEATKVIATKTGGTARVLDSILVSTFLKSGAKELEERALYWQRKLGYAVNADAIQFKTLHAEFYAVLLAMGVKLDMLTDKEAKQVLKTCVNEMGIRKDGSYLSGEDFEAISSIVAYYRNRLDEKRYQHPACNDYGLTPTMLDALVTKFKHKRQALKKFDFEDLQELLLQGLRENVHVRELVANRYNYIYLDEFQDVSQVQYEILSYYKVGAKKVIAIGDDDQTIYTWRGSDIDIITKRFEKDYNATVVKLSVNYRCPANIVRPIANSIVKNVNRYDKDVKSAKDGGELVVNGYGSLKDMGLSIVQGISEDIRNGMSVAVLCRTNFDGAIPAFLLEARGLTDFSITAGMTMDSALPKKLVSAVSLFTDKSSPAVKETLKLLLPRQLAWKAESFVNLCKNNHCSVMTVSEKDIEHSLPELEELILNLRTFVAQSDEITGYRYLLGYLSAITFAGKSTYCQNARAYIDVLLTLLESENFEDLHDFRDRVSEINLRLRSRIGKHAKITITTVHDSKGKEWDSVYIWNDSDGVFPSNRIEDGDEGQFEEERRVHYIAWTRGRKKLTVSTLKSKISPFLMETGVQVTDKVKIGGSLGNKSAIMQLDDEADELANKMMGIEG